MTRVSKPIQKKVGDGVGHISLASVEMGRHADSPKHNQSGYFDIEAGEHACLGALEHYSSDPIFKVIKAVPERSAAALAEIAALALNSPNGRRQAADPIEHTGNDPAQAILNQTHSSA